jgi:hypothetical protein
VFALPIALALVLTAASAEAGSDDESWPRVEEEPRLDLTVWGGPAWVGGGNGARSDTWAASVAWRFDQLDLGFFGGWYGLQRESAGGALAAYRAPVYLIRLGQRFETRNGLLASFTFGAGTARAGSWRSWFQVALGARATFGPVFVAGELAFESEDLMRLGFGLGVSLF